MLNADYKKQALAELKRSNELYENAFETTINDISSLHKNRLEAVKTLKGVEAYINNIANKPREYEKTTDDIMKRIKKFESDLKMLELENKKADKVSDIIAGALVTNASLAYLGGGALVAGSACGITAMEAIALVGPVGWAIGGVALLRKGVLANSKNKKIAEKAESSTRAVKIETERIKEVNFKVEKLQKTTVSLNKEIVQLITTMLRLALNDYK
ncbi:MAG: hypothetical protein E6X86_13650 [Clostridium butyricum]|nr:hypothetical protein [Clostridium butyricum]MDU4853209.1 hypothetical protein [Clostridioides difficile]